MIEFDKIAPYLKDPLVLIGFFIFIAFLLLRVLIKQNIIPTLTRRDGFSFLKLLLLYGFLFGIILMFLGFGLKYREMSEKEQRVILSQLQSELNQNLKTLNELKLNTENFLDINLNLSQILRTEGIDLLIMMFPTINLELDTVVNTVELANHSFDQIMGQNLHKNELQMNRLDAAGKAIRATIDRTIPTLNSLGDLNQSRYIINKEIWNTNLDSYRKMSIVDVTKYQDIYAELQLIRNDYGIIASNSINFYTSVSNFLDPDSQINKQGLASALSAERQTYKLIHEYSLNIYYAIEAVNELKLAIEVES